MKASSIESLMKCAFRGMIEALTYLGGTRSASITGGQLNFEPGPGSFSNDARQSTRNASHVGSPGTFVKKPNIGINNGIICS